MKNSNDTPVKQVYDIFCDFFGEERVDINKQTGTILIRFPKVTVTNEFNRSIDITELWVRVPVSYDGSMTVTPTMLRSEYTATQFRSGYAHSHMPRVNSSNWSTWANPCLGSGPIRNTISALVSKPSKELWELFCLELSKYVETESVEGVPYIKLESVGNPSNTTLSAVLYSPSQRSSSEWETDIPYDFLKYIIKKKPFSFNYTNGSYGIALPPDKLILILSNLFIEWYNSLSKKPELLRQKWLTKGALVNGSLKYYCAASDNRAFDYSTIVGSELFTFKGMPVKFNIIEEPAGANSNDIILLTKEVCTSIVSKILSIININYGKSENSSSTSKFSYCI